MSDLPSEAAGDPGEEEDDPPLLPDEDRRPPPAPGQYRQGRRFGCLWQVLFFLAMAGLGLFAATTLRGKGGTHSTTIDKGSVGKVTWEVRSSVDEQQSRCVRLYVNGASDDEPLTGGCLPPSGDASGADVHEAPLPGTGGVWVVFGQVPKGSTKAVELPLTNGTTRRVGLVTKTTDKDGYYVWVGPKGVHTADVAKLIS